MSKQQTENTKDIFAVYTQCFDKIQGNVERANPQFMQSITNLQQECFAAYGNFVHNVITTQQNYVNKIGINTSAPEATTKVVYSITDEIIKGFDVQNKTVHATLDATKQQIKAVTENAASFATLGQSVISSWISMWNQKY